MKCIVCFLIASVLLFFTVSGQPKGTVERIKVHGKSLEGNLAGDTPDRDVSVYLPAGYKKDIRKKYPVIYFLHGYTDDDAKWYGLQKHWINMPSIADRVFARGKLQDMIIVTPNAFNRYEGSMYSNSITVGNWEDYIAKDLVAYMDAHYRTLPQAKSRGLAGHSMGGYGAMRIGEKYPDVFSSIYLLSPCCLTPGDNFPENKDASARMEAVKSVDDIAKADFMTKIAFASAAAWSPNPTKAPLYLDLPMSNGEPQQFVQAKWFANMPLATIDQNIHNIKKLQAISFDAGNEDTSIAVGIKILDSVLTNYGVKHFYEEYKGDHLNRIEQRIEERMLAFFSANLRGR